MHHGSAPAGILERRDRVTRPSRAATQLNSGVMPPTSFPERMPVPSSVEASIINRAALDAIFGGWSSFHDQLLLELRLTTRGAGAPAVEGDFRLAGGYERRADGYYHATSLYDVTLRFHRVADVMLSGFLARNIIGELRLEAGGEGGVRVTLEGIGGCGGDVAFTCAAVEVVSVAGPMPPAA